LIAASAFVRKGETQGMSCLVDVVLGQQWRVRHGFRINRYGQWVAVPAGSVLVVKTVPKEKDAIWVACAGLVFRISQQRMKDNADAVE